MASHKWGEQLIINRKNLVGRGGEAMCMGTDTPCRALAYRQIAAEYLKIRFRNFSILITFFKIRFRWVRLWHHIYKWLVSLCKFHAPLGNKKEIVNEQNKHKSEYIEKPYMWIYNIIYTIRTNLHELPFMKLTAKMTFIAMDEILTLVVVQPIFEISLR